MRKTVLFILVLMLISCQKETLELPESSPQHPEALTVLGKKLEIPFTVANMQQALENLKKNRTAIKQYPLAKKGKEAQISASHYYYRFLPADSLQYERLVNDTILMVSDVPFEYEVTTTGDHYHDPGLRDHEFTYYYATVAADVPIPQAIAATKLADLYFPPEEITDQQETTLDKTSRQFKELGVDFFDDLETEALKITGNLEEEELGTLRFLTPDSEALTYREAVNKGYTLSELQIDYSQQPFQERPKWRPEGRITVEEDALNNENRIVGVMGAEVRVRKWGFLVIRTAITDSDGYFSTGRTRTKRVKYAVYFKNFFHGFTVKAGTIFWNARHRDSRTHKRQGWFPHFTNGSRTHLYALVHNAAFDYYDRIVPGYGLQKPRWGIDISAKFNMDASSQSRPHLPLMSDIRITRIRNGAYRGSDGIYASTVHELTHAGHRRMDTHMFDFLTTRNKERQLMIESWAEGVETIVTNDRYLGLDGNYIANIRSRFNDTNLSLWNDKRQAMAVNEMNEYTPIVADLIDNLNQNAIPAIFGDQPIDEVSGYSLNQIQVALDNCRSIDEWEQKLRWNFNNPTEEHLTELFNYIREVRTNLD